MWIWSSEFAWAQRLFRACARQARAAWQHAKQHPVSSIVITVGGIAAVLVAVWAVRRFELIAQARAALGI